MPIKVDLANGPRVFDSAIPMLLLMIVELITNHLYGPCGIFPWMTEESKAVPT